MCVDDYEYKHFSAIKQKICRRLHFVNEDDEERIFLVNISQFQQNGKFDLSKIIHHLSKKGLPEEIYYFYMPQLQILIKPHIPCMVYLENLNEKDLIFYMVDQSFQLNSSHSRKIQSVMEQQSSSRQIDNYISSSQMEQKSESPQRQKLQKQPQRKIGQVIGQVKRWRLLHQRNHLSLRDAANIVGVSKKSLDDYFLILRVAQYADFDFIGNFNNKMGELRHFLKKKDSKVQGRLPTEINAFKLFDLVQQQITASEMENQQSIQNTQDNSF